MTRPEVDPGSRFQPRNLGELRHPGQCLVCGSGSRVEGYVDLGTYFDYEGQMYLCAYCMEEAAAIIGCLSEAESDALQAQNLKLLAENKDLAKKLANVEQRLAGIDQYLAPLSNSLASALATKSESEVSGSVESEANSGDDGSADESDAGEPVAKEPVKSRRSNDSSRSTKRDVTGITI